MSDLFHYYHCYADGLWLPPVEEHLATLHSSGLYESLNAFRIGIVGSPENRQQVKNYLAAHTNATVEAEEDQGFEQVTQDVLYNDALYNLPPHAKILYAHTKGSSDPSAINLSWRREMTAHTVGRWREAISMLDGRYDAVGIFWSGSRQHNKFFAGTFWWANTQHIVTVGPPLHNTRFDAEAWISSNPGMRYGVIPNSPSWPSTKRVNTGLDLVLSGGIVSVKASGSVLGPNGQKLRVGNIYHFPDTPYLQMLLRSGNVQLV